MEEVFRTIQIIIIVQSALFVTYLALSGRYRTFANQVLCLFLVVLSSHMGINLVGPSWQGPNLASLGIALGFCYGPVMYLYTRSLSLENASFRRADLAHAGPPILAFLVFEILPVSIFVFAFGILASIAVYGLFSWRLITRFHAALKNTRTDFDHLKLTWLKRLLGVQCAILVLNAASSSLAMSGQIQASQAAELLVFVGLASLVNLFLFHGLQYPMLFDGVSADELGLSTTPLPGQDPSLRAVMTRIEDHLAGSQVYLRPGLTVKSLGRQIRTNPVLVSQAINACAERNFSDYVNGLRVKHAIGLLTSKDHAHESVLDIMLASGFNTKSNFNRAFKQETGSTPLAYRKAASGTPAPETDR